jgi:hypothetical protein
MTRTDDEPANLKISALVDTESAVQAAIEVYGLPQRLPWRTGGTFRRSRRGLPLLVCSFQ